MTRTPSDPLDPTPRRSALPVVALVLVLGLVALGGVALGVARRAEAPGAPAAPPAASAAAGAAGAPTPAASRPAPSTIDPAQLAGRRVDVEWLVPEIVATYPHSQTAFTQGLVFEGGRLYESTGIKGESTLREIDPTTGEVLRLRDLDPNVFGEGLALVDDRLIQLTWLDRVAYVYDRTTFEPLDTFDYEGQGWGLCYDGARLVMSDGSDTLTFRDPDTFAPLGTQRVRERGKPVSQLNELECVDGKVWANIWQSDTIVGIDPADGNVFAHVDAMALTRDARVTSPEPVDVLNGIAYDPATGHFLLTGKHWGRLYEVRFVPGTVSAAP